MKKCQRCGGEIEADIDSEICGNCADFLKDEKDSKEIEKIAAKPKKDRLFLFVMVIVTGNIGYWLILTTASLTIDPGSFSRWILFIANAIAFTGSLWLIRNYKRRWKIEKKQAEDKAKETELPL